MRATAPHSILCVFESGTCELASKGLWTWTGGGAANGSLFGGLEVGRAPATGSLGGSQSLNGNLMGGGLAQQPATQAIQARVGAAVKQWSALIA